MKLGIIGSGNVGGTLGKKWVASGHEVVFGVRDVGSSRALQLAEAVSGKLRVANIDDAIAESEIIVLAAPWKAAQEIAARAADWEGKIVVDCSNPIAPGFQLEYGHTTSGAEQIAAKIPGAYVVKAFNSTGFENMADPIYADGKLTMFICGDEISANETVAKLAEEVGFASCISGPLRHARYLEPLAMLWIEMAMREGKGRQFGLRLIER